MRNPFGRRRRRAIAAFLDAAARTRQPFTSADARRLRTSQLEAATEGMAITEDWRVALEARTRRRAGPPQVYRRPLVYRVPWSPVKNTLVAEIRNVELVMWRDYPTDLLFTWIRDTDEISVDRMDARDSNHNVASLTVPRPGAEAVIPSEATVVDTILRYLATQKAL